MDGGGLRATVEFEQRSLTSDGYGGVQGTFATVFERSARIWPRLGGEQVMAARLAGTKLVTIRVRSDTQTRTVDPEWRAHDKAHASRVFNIRSVVDPYEQDSRHGMWLDMLAEEGVAT